MKNPQRLFRSIAKKLYRGENLPFSPRCLCCRRWNQTAEAQRRGLCGECWGPIMTELTEMEKQLEFPFVAEGGAK